MEDFNNYVNNGSNDNGGNIFNLVSSLANKYDGKNQNELLMAIYREAKKGKKNGTLSNADLDNFAGLVSPFLDDKQKSMLNKVVNELKKI